MPLVAHFNGSRTEAHQLAEDEWAVLKSAYKQGTLTMTCGQPGVPKTSKLGFQYFAHKRGADCILHAGAPESAEHLALKAAAEAAAKACGWASTIEYPGPQRSWIADVLAEKDGRRVAIEIQLSPQQPTEFVRRQERYEASGIECIWLVAPHNKRNAAQVPSYVIKGSSDEVIIETPATSLGERAGDVDLTSAIRGVLTGHHMQFIEATVTAFSISTGMKRCFRSECRAWMTICRLERIQVETRCGLKGTVGAEYFGRLHLEDRAERAAWPVILKAMYADSDLARPAPLRTKNSDAAGHAYLGYTCPSCGYLQGDIPMMKEIRNWHEYVIPQAAPIPLKALALEATHICRDQGTGFCSQSPKVPTAASFPDGQVGRVWHSRELLTDALSPIPPKGTRAAAKAATGPQPYKTGDRADDKHLQRSENAAQRQPHAKQSPPPATAATTREPSAASPPAIPPISKADQPPKQLAQQESWSEARLRVLAARSHSPEKVTEMSGVKPVENMTAKELANAIFIATTLLENGHVLDVSAARRRQGLHDNLPDLLGERYPKGTV
ncbi:competence protein CoiA [Arthrobacter sp. MA-N2]|uniref:competence protein CoiA n=1 Tax=Arthrobacter sp. MA-N2 TaxID=1101188 RepID=UPI0018CC029E|nr:competence protein CoiA family protein [Arthrobacter sp. MA-N2]